MYFSRGIVVVVVIIIVILVIGAAVVIVFVTGIFITIILLLLLVLLFVLILVIIVLVFGSAPIRRLATLFFGRRSVIVVALKVGAFVRAGGETARLAPAATGLGRRAFAGWHGAYELNERVEIQIGSF